MRISYNKLWKMLIDKEMNKNDLKDAAGISAASIAKLAKVQTSQPMFFSKFVRLWIASWKISWKQ